MVDHSDTDNTKVAVVILTINQQEKTIACLKSLRSIKSPPFEIVLWDNGSSDGTTDYVQKAFPEVLVHHHPTNLGVASGRNAAAELAIENFRPSYLLFLDNDAIVSGTSFEPLLTPFQVNEKLAQTSPKSRSLENQQLLNNGGGARIRYWFADTHSVGAGEVDEGQYDVPKQCIPVGTCMMVRTAVFQELGGFDRRYSPYGYEDLDFSLRVSKAGYYGLYIPEFLIFHKSSRTPVKGGMGAYTEEYARIKAKRWFLFLRTHGSLTQKLGFFLIGLPYIVTRAFIRAAFGGDLGAIRGLYRGLWDFLRSGQRNPGAS